MELLRARMLPLFILVGLVASGKGAPKRNAHKKHVDTTVETAKSRSYIDIDATDPFKVPKSSHYINRPIPEFSQSKDDNKESEESERHHGREHEDAGSPKGAENADEDAKNMEAGSHERERERERERDRDREEGDKENSMEKSNDSSEEHEANIEEQAPSQDEPTTSSAMPKEIDLSENGRSSQNMEQDSQPKQSIQNADSGNEEADEGYKKTHIDPNIEEEEGTTSNNNNNNNNNSNSQNTAEH